MKLFATVLAAAIALGGAAAPARADGQSSTRNTVFFGALGAAAVVGILGARHRRHHAREAEAEQVRRQDSYRAYYFDRYGHYPSDAQFRSWYARQYGKQPQ